VAENIVLGAEPGSAASLDLRKAAAEIRKVSDEFKLSVDPNATIESLSVGQNVAGCSLHQLFHLGFHRLLARAWLWSACSDRSAC